MLQRRKVAYRIVTLAATLLVCLFFAEAALRLVWTPPSLRSTPAFEPHPLYWVAPIPGARGIHATSEYEHSFAHTAQGLRGDRVFSASRPDGVERRVLFLGDSFVYGLGVRNEETFVALLDAALPRVEMANAGCNAYGTREELAVLDALGRALRPDLTVLVFFWNDLGNNLERPTPAFDLDEQGRVVRLDEPVGVADPLALRPTPPSELRSKWKALYLRRLLKEGLRGFRYRVLGRKPRFIQTREQSEQAWRVTHRLLELVGRRATELGSELIVVSIPSQNRVDPSAKIKNIEPLHIEIEERLHRVCRELGLKYVDLLPPMREVWRRDGKDLYYYADLHLTTEGHRVVAELLKPIVVAVLEGEASS